MNQQPVEIWSEYHQLGESFKQQGNLPEAILAYDQAIKLNPQAFWSYHQLGEILIQQEKYSEAIEIYQKAILIQNDFSWSYYNLGDAFSQLEQWEKALEAYQKFIKLNPDFWGGYHQLGDVYSRLQQWEDALNMYNQAIKINPNFAWSYHNLGEALFYLKKFTEAEKAYEQAIFLDPYQRWYYENLMKVLKLLEKRDRFGEVYQMMINYFHPNDSQMYKELGDMLGQNQQFEDAVKAYQKALKITPSFFEVYHGLGDTYIALERWEDAVKIYRQALQLKSEFAWTHSNLGMALSKLKLWRESVESLEKAIEILPNIAWFHTYLADNLYELGEVSSAFLEYQKAIKIDPDQRWIHDAFFEKVEKYQQIDEAINFYQESIVSVKHPYYYETLGRLLIKKDQWKLAITYFIKTLKINLDSPQIYEYFCEILKQKGEITSEEINNCLSSFIIPEYIVKNYCPLEPNSLVSSDSHPSITCMEIYPGITQTIPPSIYLNNSLQFHLNFNEKLHHFPRGFLAIIPQGRAWCGRYDSVIMTPDHKMINDLSMTNSGFLLLSSDELPPPQYLSGKVVLLSTRWCGTNYYHWMFDLLPRIGYFKSVGFDTDMIDYWVVNTQKFNYQRETLLQLGIPDDKIIESVKIPYLQASELIVPSLDQMTMMISPWTCNFLKNELFSPELLRQKNKPEKIYISRELTSMRKIINELEVTNYLESRGFYQLSLESLSVQEQASYLASAKVVVAPHGAGLTNLVFSQPGTKVIEIFSPQYLNYCYWLLSGVCNLEHYSLLGENNEQLLKETPWKQNILVNLSHLEQLLNLAGVY